jgi:Major Facilitator Superfamily
MSLGDGTSISSMYCNGKSIRLYSTSNVSLTNVCRSLPLGAVAMAIIFFFLDSPIPKGTIKEKLKRVDYVGTLIVLSFATLFLLAMNFGGQTFPWNSAAVIVPLVLTIVLIGVLCVVESRFAKEPIMPPRLFKSRSVVSIMCTNFFFGCTFFAMVFYLPVYMQVVRGDSATQSGLRLIPMQMVICVLSTGAGWAISRFGQWKPFLHFGTAVLCVGVGLLSLFDEFSSWSMVYGITSFCGLGIGALYGSALIGIQASAEPRDIAVVTGLCNFTRILGGALGIAIASAILNSSLTASLPQHMPSEIALQVIDSSLYVRDGLPPQYFDATMECYVAALKLLWQVMTAFSGVGFLASLFIKHSSLRGDKPKTTTVVSDTEKVETTADEQPSTTANDAVIEVSDHETESSPKH